MSTPEQLRAKILLRLQEKGVFGACPSCSKNSWQVFDRRVAQRLIGQEPYELYFQAQGAEIDIPMIYLFCTNCGHVRAYATKILFPEGL